MMERFNVPEEDVEKAITKMEAGTSLIDILKGILFTGLFGAILSAIIGAIMKKNPPEYA